MGTRCITEVRSKWNDGDWRTHAVIFRHWDGYPECHGAFLAEFLKGVKVVNGMTGEEKGRVANGPGRLASLLVFDLLAEGHDPDLMGEVTDCGQEFHYQIDVDYGMDTKGVTVRVFDGPVKSYNSHIFEGTIEEFGGWISEKTAPEKVVE